MDAFETWVYSGVRYLAVPNGNGGSSIICATGEHYGSWQNVENFRKRQRAGRDQEMLLGRARLAVIHIVDARDEVGS